MSSPVLEVSNVTRNYKTGNETFQALKGVSFTVERGESVAVVGKSGSGKSTLMHLMSLLDTPNSGTISINGTGTHNLNSKELEQLRNKEFGFIFQQFFLISNQTVLDNVIVPLKIAGIPAKERKERGLQLLEQLELADKANNKATDLSGGQKQRVVIARALINNPSIIFADEPTGNLDSGTGEVVEEILFNLNSTHNITLIVVTHDPELATKLNRQIHMKDGLIITDTKHGK